MILARLHHKTRTWRSLMTAYIKKKRRKRQKDQVRRRGNQMGSKLAPDPSRLTPLTSRHRRVLFSSKDRGSFANERVLPCAYIMKASTLVSGDTQEVMILAVWDKRRKLWDVLNWTKGIRGFLRNKALCMTLTSIFIYLFIIFGGSWGAGRSAEKQSKQSTLKPDVCVCVRDTDRER